MSDLVERLREWDPMADDQPVYPDELLNEAADRIEALEAALREIVLAPASKMRDIAYRALQPPGGEHD